MKKISKAAFIFKTLVFFTLVTGLSAYNVCEGQSIVGKWKIISNTFYYTAEGAVKQGQAEHVNLLPTSASVISEFKSDHTFTKTTHIDESSAPSFLNGTWTLAGDKLTMTVDPKYNPKKGHESMSLSIKITGNSMIMTDTEHISKMISKMDTNAERI
jgi:hypothetical protein